MWSRVGRCAANRPWSPNHFVPLVKSSESATTTNNNHQSASTHHTENLSYTEMQVVHMSDADDEIVIPMSSEVSEQPEIDKMCDTTQTLQSLQSRMPMESPVVENRTLKLVEAHKGGLRLQYNGYIYVRDKVHKDKM